MTHEDPQCEVAHGHAPAEPTARTLVAVFASPVAEYLLRYGSDAGYRPVLLEPDADRSAVGCLSGQESSAVGCLSGQESTAAGPAAVKVVSSYAECAGPDVDVVLTDHHRPELGPILRDVLAAQANWIGIMGSPRHTGPHVAALTELGVPAAEIARVHRPIGLNIGSKAPPEIAIATLAGLIAEHNGCPGGFDF